MQWILSETNIIHDLEPKAWPDPSHPRRIEILCLGAGKGHEIAALREALPSAVVRGVDPHDHYAPPVARRLENDYDAMYLHERVSADDLQEIQDKSQDAVTLFFVFHHMELNEQERTLAEISRVLKNDGFVYVAEDLVGNETERHATERADRRINAELADGPHEYRNQEEWMTLFARQGFDVVRFHETKPSTVRHGWFTLKRRQGA